MNLRELQRRMASDITRPLTADNRMQSEAEDGSSVEEVAASYIKPNDRLSSFQRLEIYNRQYWFRVIGAVAEDFSALQAVVGKKNFDALVLAYLRANPSESFTLRNLGAKLPAWLELHPGFCSGRHQLSVDVARLEWAYIESYDGATRVPLGEADFASLTGDSRLSLQPHLQLLALSYPVDQLVLAVHAAAPPTDAVSNAVSERRMPKCARLPSTRRAATFLAVHRVDDTVYYRRLNREAYLLLASLHKQSTLAEALEIAFVQSQRATEEQVEEIRAYFTHAAQLGWLCQLDDISLATDRGGDIC